MYRSFSVHDSKGRRKNKTRGKFASEGPTEIDARGLRVLSIVVYNMWPYYIPLLLRTLKIYDGGADKY